MHVPKCMDYENYSHLILKYVTYCAQNNYCGESLYCLTTTDTPGRPYYFFFAAKSVDLFLRYHVDRPKVKAT